MGVSRLLIFRLFLDSGIEQYARRSDSPLELERNSSNRNFLSRSSVPRSPCASVVCLVKTGKTLFEGGKKTQKEYTPLPFALPILPLWRSACALSAFFLFFEVVQ